MKVAEVYNSYEGMNTESMIIIKDDNKYKITLYDNNHKWQQMLNNLHDFIKRRYKKKKKLKCNSCIFKDKDGYELCNLVKLYLNYIIYSFALVMVI